MRTAGWTSVGQITVGVAVAYAESGGRPTATNVNRNGSRDLGLWQINDGAHPWIKGQNWQDPAVNTAAAFRVWREAGGSWRPWVAYTSGSYRQYLLQGKQGADNPQSPGAIEGDPAFSLNPLDGIGDAAQSVADAVKLGAAAAQWLASPHNWLRVAWVAGGGVMILAGLNLAARPLTAPAVSSVKGVAKTVATKGR